MIAFLGGGLALPGCQDMGEDRAPATSDPVLAEAPGPSGYPPLQSVPPRPRLSYPVEQQREIINALIGDREHARYTSQVVRYRSGLSSLPPPPTPPVPAPVASLEPQPVPTPAPVEPPLGREETLVDFLAAVFSNGADEEVEPSSGPDPLEEFSDGDDPDDGGAPTGATSDAPLPPARSAVAARLAAGPEVIDALVDPSVAQMPLPPGQSALAARLAVAERIASARVHVPAPRPAGPTSAAAVLPVSVPAPAPLKPIYVSAPPTPVEKPADDRSASASSIVANPGT